MAVSVLCDIACELGEGPSYDPRTDTLWWFDIVGRKLIEWPFAKGAAIVHDLPFMASVLARIDDDNQLIAAEDGLYVRETSCGAFKLIKPLEADNEVTRSNDGRVHPSGALWVGTMGKKAETGAGAIYWYFKGELRTLYPDISIPNSICFSPDGAIAYFSDTVTNKIMKVACDPATGLPTGEPEVFFDNEGDSSGSKGGWPDGSVCDAEGKNCKELGDLEEILAKSRNPAEQLAAWQGWHDTTGRAERDKFLRFVDLANAGARGIGFASMTAMSW